MSRADSNTLGVVGEFSTARAAAAAARNLAENGFTRWDVYGPAPVEEIDNVVPTRRGRWLVAIMVAIALLGACAGYLIQYWDAVLSYPVNVGGRPDNGWPGFVPSAWEVSALFTVCGGFLAFLVSCRLPRLYHWVFLAPDFERASQDRFFICVEGRDEAYDGNRLRTIMQQHGAERVTEIGA